MNNIKRFTARNEYQKLINVFYSIVDSKAGNNLTEDEIWLMDTETLALKLYYHLSSLFLLSLGTPVNIFKDQKKIFYDYSSINVLARVSLETYLTFFYIYCDSDSGIEKLKYRHSVWKIGATIDRLSFNINSNEAIQILAKDKQYLDKKLKEIESSPVYLEMDEKLRRKSKKGKWRLDKSWADLAEIAGFAKPTFKSLYSYLCVLLQ